MSAETPQQGSSEEVLIGIARRVIHGLPKNASNADLAIATEGKQEKNAQFIAQLPEVDPDNPIAKKILGDLEKEQKATAEGRPSPSLLRVLELDESASNEDLSRALGDAARKSTRKLLDLGEDSSEDEVEKKFRHYWEIYKQ